VRVQIPPTASMKNIELKVRVDDFGRLIPVLKARAEYNEKLNQIDTYYNCGKKRLKIRMINDTRFQKISYKRPNKNGSKISNYHIHEIEPNKIRNIQYNLENKFGQKTIIKKQRELWIYKHTRIHLDKVRGLGKFVELETVMRNLAPRKAKQEHFEIIKLLNLSKYKKYDKSYSDMIQ
jgi:predicted adenylyl cyclase CyaB